MTVALVDKVGRKPIQLMGFIVLTILFCIIGFAFNILSSKALLILYVLCQFFFNFGKSFHFVHRHPAYTSDEN